MRLTVPVKVSPGSEMKLMDTGSPTRTSRSAGSGTSADTQTVLRSAMVMRGAVVSLWKETALRYSPGATLISMIFPEMGARTNTNWRTLRGVRPRSSSFRLACSRRARADSSPSVAWVRSFRAPITSFSAMALCSYRSLARERSACALVSVAWA